MIQLQEVTKIYEDSTTAVDHVSLEAKQGETFGLIGTSGCGKTTTLKMINRLIEPTSGQILVNGSPVSDQPVEQLRRGIGYVIQSVGLFPHYTIAENVAVVPKLMGWEPERIQRRTRELLELVGLDAGRHAARKPDALSGGQQQRVGLARALAVDPPLLLMDEPFGALDPITKEQIRDEFRKLLAELDKTVILVTHDVLEAFDLCDRICLMDAGRIRQTGTPKELLFHPEHEFVHDFFDNHRIRLEMMSITVADLLEVLEEPGRSRTHSSSREEKEKGEVIHPSDTFYSIFGSGHTDEKIYRVMNTGGENQGSYRAGELLDAFQKLRNVVRAEAP